MQPTNPRARQCPTLPRDCGSHCCDTATYHPARFLTTNRRRATGIIRWPSATWSSDGPLRYRRRQRTGVRRLYIRCSPSHRAQWGMAKDNLRFARVVILRYQVDSSPPFWRDSVAPASDHDRQPDFRRGGLRSLSVRGRPTTDPAPRTGDPRLPPSARPPTRHLCSSTRRIVPLVPRPCRSRSRPR
jgi:hypothetical protein